MRTVVVDYEAGNLKSVETALRRIGAEFTVTGRAQDLGEADAIVFPGVGDGAHAMSVLKRLGLDAAMASAHSRRTPILGICVGCQIALDRTEERDAACLGLVPGAAVRFTSDLGLKIPHMGWNNVEHRDGHWLFSGVPQGASFYFVHSYYPRPQDGSHAIAWTDYGVRFVSAIENGSLAAVQFHPEKSGEVGLRVLRNFLDRVAGE